MGVRDLQLVHQPEHDLGEPAGVVAAAGRLARRAEARAGRARGRGSAGSAPPRSRTARPGSRPGRGAAARPGPRPSSASRSGGGRPGRRGSAAAAGARPEAGTCPRRRSRSRGCRAPRGAGAGTPRSRRTCPRAGRSHVSESVDERHVGRPARGALAHAGAVARAADLPDVAEVAEPDVVGGVEARRRRPDTARAGSGTPDRRGPGGPRAVAPQAPAAPYRSPRADDPPRARRSCGTRNRSTRVAGPCAQISLHDTRTGQARAARAPGPWPRRHLRLRPDGLRTHPRRQRPAVRGLLAAQAIPRARGLSRSHFVANVTDVNDKIYAAALPAGRAAPSWPRR